jgi:LPXTG-site transpeptidase (sortase) family protein
MEKRRFLTTILAVCMLLALAVPAFALEYTFDEDEQSGYGKPTSVDPVVTADGGAQKNEDVSKNAAIIPPGFGTPTSNTLNTGEYLTPDLVPSSMAATGATVNGDFVVVFPPDMSGLSTESVPADLAAGSTMVPGSADVTVTVPESTSSGYTEVTDDLYYKDGSLGTLEIPAIGLTVDIFEGTDAATLKRGAGHFEDTSIWDGNVGFAAHNRGANSYFGKIHTLELGDRITLTTRLGTRTYEVTSVSKVSETDRSALAASQSNVITLYTCVRDERDFRWCVTGAEIV